MPKRELSPESKERKQRPLQQQKSVSDTIGPMVAQVHLDLSSNSSLDSMASQNASAAKGNDNLGSNGSSRQRSQELGESMDDIVTEESCTTANGSADMIGEVAKCAAENTEDTVEGSLDLFAGGLHKSSNLADLVGACVLQKQVSVHTWCVYLVLDDVAHDRSRNSK